MSVHGFSNSTLYATNVDFRGVTPVVDQMTADGQLLIGSSVAPYIRSGLLTSTGATVAITVGHGTINLETTGGGVTSIIGDSGTASGPNLTIYADNAANTSGATVQFINSANLSTLFLSGANGNTFMGASCGSPSYNFGSANVGVGNNAFSAISGGSFSVGIGSSCLASLTTGNSNSSYGYQSMYSATTAFSNCSYGFQSLYSSVSDANNVAMGVSSLFSLNGGQSNVSIGNASLFSSVSDSNNVAIGNSALTNLNGAGGLTAVGYQAMYSALAPLGCTATGNNCLYSTQNDQYHCAYGDSALYSVNGSSNCAAFGAAALASLVTGSNSTALGCFALTISTNATGNIGIGYNAGSNIGTTDSFNVLIASNGISGDNGVIRIGDATGSAAQNTFTAAYVCGITSNTQDPISAGPQVVTISSSNQLGVTSLLTGAIQTIDTDVGSVTGSTITLYANNAANDNGATVAFTGKTSTTIELQTTDSNGNTFVGKGSGNIANIGLACSGFGNSSSNSVTNGLACSSFGDSSLFANTTGQYLTAIGTNSLFSINGAQYTTALGYNSGSAYTGTEASNVVINAVGVLGESNVGRIGSGTGVGAQQLAEFFLSGVNGNTLGGTPLMVVIDSSTDQLGVQAIPTGGIVGFASTVSTTASTSGTVLAVTGTVPTTSNTTLLTSVTYTPTSATNKLKFDFSCPFSSDANQDVGFFLFQGTTLLASFPVTGTSGGRGNTAAFDYVMTSGTTSSTTYHIYFAPSSGTTAYALTDTGTAYYGATGSTSLTFSVTEIA